MSDLIYKEEAYQIIGVCMDVHNVLGGGFLEIVYKDAIEYEFQKQSICRPTRRSTTSAGPIASPGK